MDIDEFKEELRHVLNVAGADDFAGAPDYILAEYLTDALIAFRKTHRNANQWRGIPEWVPGQKITIEQPDNRFRL